MDPHGTGFNRIIMSSKLRKFKKDQLNELKENINNVQ